MKENKKQINMAKLFWTIILVVAMLFIVMFSNYITNAEITNIISVQGNYPIGDTFGLYSGSDNLTELFDSYTPTFDYDSVNGWDANNDTVFYGIEGAIEDAYFGNYNTYIGNGNHTTIVNWSHMPLLSYEDIRYLLIPLNITNSELALYDFARVNTDLNKTDGAEVRIYYEESATSLLQINPITIDTDTDLFPMDYSTKQTMNLYPNGTVYLVFVGLDDWFTETQTSFTWQIESNSLLASDYAFSSDFTNNSIWFIVRMVFAFILTLAVIFINPWFDTKIDMKKRRGK